MKVIGSASVTKNFDESTVAMKDDIENNKIYFYNHDYPGDVHPSC